MRTQTQTVNNAGRLAVLIAMALVAALVAIGLERVKPATAAGSTFSLSASTYNVTEGNSVNIVVNRTGGSGAVDVQLSIGGGTATPGAAGDYNVPSFITVSFPNGVFTNSFPFAPIDDGADEDTETVTASISLLVGGDSLQAPTTATINIIDNDGPSTYSYQSSAVSVAEGTGAFTVTVLRNGSTTGSAQVDCSVTGGTATGGSG